MESRHSEGEIFFMESELSDIRHDLLESYPNISNFMSTFQVLVDPGTSLRMYGHRRFKDSIFVFKKKRLLLLAWASNMDIYAAGLRGLELDALNHNKSRSSCDRCRRYKKKCTRDLPECINCSISDELCVYKPRKKRCYSQPNIKIGQGSSGLASPVIPHVSYLLHGKDLLKSYGDVTLPRTSNIHQVITPSLDTPSQTATPPVQGKSRSDLMKLLN